MERAARRGGAARYCGAGRGEGARGRRGSHHKLGGKRSVFSQPWRSADLAQCAPHIMTELCSSRSLYNRSPSVDSTCSTTLSMADRLETMYNSSSPPLSDSCPPPKKRKVNFSLTLDIKQESSDDACVPQLPHSNTEPGSDVESYYSDLPVLPTTPHGGPQVPPLTPGTNLKVGEALRATYSSWNDKTRQLGIPRDPRIWENIEVIAWLDWAANEFQLYSDTVTSFIRTFQLSGRAMCELSKEEFCSRAPVFVGDILWEHLVLLQADCDREKAALKNAPQKLSEASTELPVSVSPPRQYRAPTPPTYTTLEAGQFPAQHPALPSHPVTVKSEYPGTVYSSGYGSYPGDPAHYPGLAGYHHPGYPEYQAGYPGVEAAPAGQVSGRWPPPPPQQQRAAAHQFQVRNRIISHYQPRR